MKMTFQKSIDQDEFQSCFLPETKIEEINKSAGFLAYLSSDGLPILRQ